MTIPDIANFDLGFGDLVDDLNFAFSAMWGIQYQRFGFTVDTLYSDFSTSGGTPGPLFSSVDLDMSQLYFDIKASYRIVGGARTKVDFLAGARRNDIDVDLMFHPGVVGVPVFVNTGEAWWDATGGVRIRQDLNDHVSLGIGYRYLDYDFEGNSGFVYDVATSGLLIGAQFSF